MKRSKTDHTTKPTADTLTDEQVWRRIRVMTRAERRALLRTIKAMDAKPANGN